ncbi:hypothetical protein PR048_009604 [Dryococelus australis]|uniref:Integrase catalytic domain-containing protein n=1 Tax=Dryococelus australis TaxID=614101 RepID=A0ABQ9I0C9_9NEOP|nr:hypothetical protein PR048_009604 [Dryococelus australis]
MKLLAYLYEHWKVIDTDIEYLFRSCSEFVAIKNSPAKAPSHPWEETEHNWNGFPEVMVSDNATIFTSEEFAQFYKVPGIFQKFCEAGHPATNSFAEHKVEMLKNRLAQFQTRIILGSPFLLPGYTFEHWDVSCETAHRTTPINRGPASSQENSSFDPQPKSPMSDDRQLNKPNLGDLTEIMDPDMVGATRCGTV